MTAYMVKLPLCILVLFVTLADTGQALSQIALPAVKKTCPEKNFRDWLGDLELNGPVKPPDVLKEPGPDCEFFMMAERMFLWLTSPAPADYGQGRYVFDTPAFYQVSPLNGQKRILTLNASDVIKKGSVSISQVGVTGDPVAADSEGNLRNFVRRQLAVPPFKRVIVNGNSVFTDSLGRIVTTGLDVDLPAVLMTQRNGLVYYTIEVNDVYAFFLSGAKPPINKIQTTHFPINEGELRDIERAVGKSLSVPNLLAVEIKFAWIDAERIVDKEEYIKTWANIPTYDKVNEEKRWVQNGWRNARLALVGMHIAFGASAHKELIWATFEHINNAPNVAYPYNNDHNKMCWYPPIPHSKCRYPPATTGQTWLFSRTGNIGAGMQNQRQMHLRGNDIEADDGHVIGPSDVVRVSPWGSGVENANKNTDVISINASVRSQLKPRDVRRNYVMIGTMWDQKGGATGNSTGSTTLANSTMETFFQPSNCIGCHRGTGENMLGRNERGGGVSHIYDATVPLKLGP